METNGFGFICTEIDRRVMAWADAINALGYSTYFVVDDADVASKSLDGLFVVGREGNYSLPVFSLIDRKSFSSYDTYRSNTFAFTDCDPEEFRLRATQFIRTCADTREWQKKNRNQAIELAKSEAVIKQREEFLAICAHDLRSPLGIIQSTLSMVLNARSPEVKLPATHVDLLERAKRQAVHSLQLVKDLLDVVVLEHGLSPQYEILSVDKTLKEMIQDFQGQAQEKHIQLDYVNPVKDWRILADGDRVHQLLQNLFVNALKFTEPGKKILLTVIPFQGRRKTDPPHPMMIVSLKDEGKGIPSSELQRIFDRFSQVREMGSREGRGLGLTVAKQISTLHGGNIWVQSIEGSGSTFFILFPHVISRTTPFNPVADRILVVDPSAYHRDKYFGDLSRWGYDPVFASNGAEAVAQFFHSQPSTLILSPDLTKISEIDVANLIQSEVPEGSVQVLLGSEDSLSVDPFGPFDGFLKLPFHKDQLRATIENKSEEHMAA